MPNPTATAGRNAEGIDTVREQFLLPKALIGSILDLSCSKASRLDLRQVVHLPRVHPARSIARETRHYPEAEEVSIYVVHR